MRQALHIFKKDVRYLRWEIAIFVTLSAFFAWVQLSASVRMPYPEILLFGSAYLVARSVHAEAIPGDTQFWITRPYRWTSLLLAKLLFIVVAVNVPVFLLRLALLVGAGFPLGANLPGLLFSQALIVMLNIVPFTALAAVTSSLAGMVLAVLVVYLAPLVMTKASEPDLLAVWQMQWIRNSAGVVIFLAIVSWSLVKQYRDRATLYSRIAGTLAVVVGFAAYLYLPLPFERDLQTVFSSQPSESAAVQIRIDPDRKSAGTPSGLVPPNVGADYFRLSLPIEVSGVAEGREVRIDSFDISFEGASERRAFHPWVLNESTTPDNYFNGNIYVDASFFHSQRAQPVTIKGTVFGTLFGNPEEHRVRIQVLEAPTNVIPGLQVYARGSLVRLRSAFRWPRKLIYVRNGNRTDASRKVISYSPFPGEIRFNPIEEEAIGGPLVSSEVTVITKEPLAHFRRDMEFRARLEDLVVSAN